jgi:hypothetical protein
MSNYEDGGFIRCDKCIDAGDELCTPCIHNRSVIRSLQEKMRQLYCKQGMYKKVTDTYTDMLKAIKDLGDV